MVAYFVANETESEKKDNVLINITRAANPKWTPSGFFQEKSHLFWILWSLNRTSQMPGAVASQMSQ
jgi:hypothetical protein